MGKKVKNKLKFPLVQNSTLLSKLFTILRRGSALFLGVYTTISLARSLLMTNDVLSMQNQQAAI